VEKFGTKAEMKNLNSFRYLQRALEYEIERQIGVLESGGRVEQETRQWNVAAGRTEPMRSKEFAHDYRYFPEPDLLPVHCSETWLAGIRGGLPELPDALRTRLVEQFGIGAYHAGVLTATRALANYFEETVQAGAPGASAANWITTELLRGLNEAGQDISACPVSPRALAEVIHLVGTDEITALSGKKLLRRMMESGRSPRELIAEEGLSKMGDTGELERIARAVLDKHSDNAAKYRAGNEGVLKFFIGQVVRETRGLADPQSVTEILKRLLS